MTSRLSINIRETVRDSGECEFRIRNNRAVISPEYVRHLITVRKLIPPTDDNLNLDAWPWPVKIRTLGGFTIERDGVPLSFTGKVQRQPLALLKLVIAYGGRDVSEARLIDTLWPETEGDAARVNLRSSVHRLRKLIGADALRNEDGRLSLDPARCWVDAWALSVTEHLGCTRARIGLLQRLLSRG